MRQPSSDQRACRVSLGYRLSAECKQLVASEALARPRFAVGLPLLFYESLGSRGRGCVFTIASVRSNRVVWAETLSDRLLMKGVLDRETITQMSRDGLVSVLHFDNVIPFRKPVRLNRLREFGAIDAANAVAPRRLKTSTLTAISGEAGVLAL